MCVDNEMMGENRRKPSRENSGRRKNEYISVPTEASRGAGEFAIDFMDTAQPPSEEGSSSYLAEYRVVWKEFGDPH